MPPDGYTAVTIPDETVEKLFEIMATADLESRADAIDYAADAARDPDSLDEAELARLLARRLAD